MTLNITEAEDFSYINRNVKAALDRISAACARAGRKPDEVTLLAVTKMKRAEEASAAVAAGIRNVGESRVQEAEWKKPFIAGEYQYHLIGHLQTNKAKEAVELFDVIQSVDSLRIALKLSEEATQKGKTLTVYAQVNTSGEETKSGFAPDEFVDHALEIGELPGLSLRGAMTIGPLTDDKDEARRAFAATRILFEKLKGADPKVETLSMGMSDDMEIAIEEGATLVRVGRDLFARG